MLLGRQKPGAAAFVLNITSLPPVMFNTSAPSFLQSTVVRFCFLHREQQNTVTGKVKGGESEEVTGSEVIIRLD